MPWRDELLFQHAQRKNDSQWRQRVTIESPQGTRLVVGGRTYLNFCSNDYLGLANHPHVANASVAAIKTRGTSSGASHLVCGHSDEHHLLEMEIAKFVGAEKAVVFSTGYMANLAIPQTLLGRGDLILQDRLNHASLIDAGRYCEANMKRYPHLDQNALEKLLTESQARRKLVETDGVFSMDGDIAPVHALREQCKNHEAVLLVDDAHGFGVLGKSGAGTLSANNVAVSGNVLMMGTLGKAAGSFGAFIAGDEVYIESLVQFARTYIYTTALPPSVIAATRTAIELIQTESDRRKHLHRNIKQFRERIQGHAELGKRILNSTTPIQPLVFGSSIAAFKASQLLWEQGIWVSAIRPPTVPKGGARLRITLTADHDCKDIQQLVDVLNSDPMKRIIEESNQKKLEATESDREVNP